jgi:hypothetical protein
MCRGGGVAVADRILRVSTTFRRSVEKLGIVTGSRPYRAVSAALRSLAVGDLPGVGDFETSFSPGRAHVRRVVGHNVWVLYRFDGEHVSMLTVRGEPPVPIDA